MTMDRHESIEELISASLSGDLSGPERQRLDAHLDGCDGCRATLAAFADQRRIMSGLRHVAPPRDLGARVRTRIERGAFATVPWWRRPAVIFTGVGGSLAAVAGALLAVVLLNGSPDEPNVGANSPTPTPVTTSSATPEPTVLASAEPSLEPAMTLPPVITDPSPDATPVDSSAPVSPSVEPTATPVPASPEPDVFLALTGPFDNLALTVQEPQPADEPPNPILEIGEGPNGPPIAAELSPDGRWLAHINELGLSGRNEVYITRLPGGGDSSDSPIAVGATALLIESVAGSPFLEQLTWSPDGHYLAYTVTDGGGTDAFVFEPSSGEGVRLTEVGNAYAGSWTPSTDGVNGLWISTAGDEPISYLIEFEDRLADMPKLIDPAEHAAAVAEGVFQPLLNPDGHLAIYWTGRMEQQTDEWLFVDGGMPILSEHRREGDSFELTNDRPLFSDVTVDSDSFMSAGIAWGTDGDAYAVWATDWTGESQVEGTQYPDASRVYFGHATDPRGLTESHAMDEGDLPEETSVVDVKVSPTGEHLLVTVRHPLPGDQSPPRAELLLIERNTGDEADTVRSLGFGEGGWFGPAAFDRDVED